MNEYEIAGIMCICIAVLWLAASILSSVIQHVWAWVDDSSASDENWLLKKIDPKLNLSKWKYPVYCSASEKTDPTKMGKIHGYAKDKKYLNKSVIHANIENGRDYVYSFEINARISYIHVIAITILSPIIILLLIDFYALTLSALTLIIIANLARFSRRTKKAFDKHVVNKDAHKE